MNDLRPSLYPEFREEYESAQNLHIQIMLKGSSHSTYEIGPICSRDHAYSLADLRKAVKAFLKVLPEPEGSTPEYRRLKQALHSELNHTP